MDLFTYENDENKVLVYRSVYAPVKSNMFTILTGKEAVVFDPSMDENLLGLFEKNKIEKVYILLTHGHYDHISGVEWLKEYTGAKVFCQSMCAKRLLNPRRPLARLVATVLAQQDREDGGHRYQDFKASYRPFTIVADKTFDQEEVLKIGDLKFNVISTPGHSEGSACYELFDKLVFTGDTLFRGSWGRTDLPTGSFEDIINSITKKLMVLPKNTIVYPGHRKIYNDRRRRTNIFRIKTKKILNAHDVGKLTSITC